MLQRHRATFVWLLMYRRLKYLKLLANLSFIFIWLLKLDNSLQPS